MDKLARKMPALHPGEIIKEEYLEAYGLTQVQLAELLGLSRVVLSRILNGHASITATTAVRLAEIFKTSAKYWLNLQAMYDIDRARQNEEKALKLLQKIFPGKPQLVKADEVKSRGKIVTVKNFEQYNRDRRSDTQTRALVDRLAKIDEKNRRPGRKKKGD